MEKPYLMNNLGKYPIYLTACLTSEMHKISHGDIFLKPATTSPVSFKQYAINHLQSLEKSKFSVPCAIPIKQL